MKTNNDILIYNNNEFEKLFPNIKNFFGIYYDSEEIKQFLINEKNNIGKLNYRNKKFILYIKIFINRWSNIFSQQVFKIDKINLNTKYDYNLKSRILLFQKRYNINFNKRIIEDGIPGPQTFNAIQEVLSQHNNEKKETIILSDEIIINSIMNIKTNICQKLNCNDINTQIDKKDPKYNEIFKNKVYYERLNIFLKYFLVYRIGKNKNIWSKKFYLFEYLISNYNKNLTDIIINLIKNKDFLYIHLQTEKFFNSQNIYGDEINQMNLEKNSNIQQILNQINDILKN